VEPAAVLTRRTRWQTALVRVGSIAVLAFGSACASPEPAPAPRTEGPYIASGPQAFEGSVVGEGHCVEFVKATAGVPSTAA
jgi:hypothetical protein